MSILILGQNFRPTWDQLVPYINRESVCDPRIQQQLLTTAQKALYVFLCKVVKGLDPHIQALDKEYQINMDTTEKPYSEHINKSIKESLEIIRGFTRFKQVADVKLVSDEMSSLKGKVEQLMRLEAAPEWKIWRKKCFCF